jgi:hypothetical protein
MLKEIQAQGQGQGLHCPPFRRYGDVEMGAAGDPDTTACPSSFFYIEQRARRRPQSPGTATATIS